MEYFFKLWKSNAAMTKSFREYDKWCETNDEELQGPEYSDTDPNYSYFTVNTQLVTCVL